MKMKESQWGLKCLGLNLLSMIRRTSGRHSPNILSRETMIETRHMTQNLTNEPGDPTNMIPKRSKRTYGRRQKGPKIRKARQIKKK